MSQITVHKLPLPDLKESSPFARITRVSAIATQSSWSFIAVCILRGRAPTWAAPAAGVDEPGSTQRLSCSVVKVSRACLEGKGAPPPRPTEYLAVPRHAAQVRGARRLRYRRTHQDARALRSKRRIRTGNSAVTAQTSRNAQLVSHVTAQIRALPPVFRGPQIAAPCNPLCARVRSKGSHIYRYRVRRRAPRVPYFEPPTAGAPVTGRPTPDRAGKKAAKRPMTGRNEQSLNTY